MSNMLYQETRQFEHVFPTVEEFILNIKPLIKTHKKEIDNELIEIYNTLMLRYSDNYYKYANIGSIYAKTGEEVQKIISVLIFLDELNLSSPEQFFSNRNTTDNFSTDNTSNQNIEGFLNTKTINTSITALSTKNFIELRMNVNNLLNQKYINARVLFMSNIPIFRGEDFE